MKTRTPSPTHPDLVRMQQPDAEPAGTGPCGACLQVRPLFHHTLTETWREEHDECDDCMGHERKSVQKATLCVRCWSNAPTTVELADLG